MKTGQCVDFSGKLPVAGAAGVTWDCLGDTWKRWAFDTEFGLLVNFQNPDYCLSHGDASQAIDDERWVLDAFGSNNGDTLGQWTYHGNANQRWHWSWLNADESMHVALNKMQQGLSYDLKLQTTDDNCGLEW